MRDRYRLGGLENDELLAALSALMLRERELLSDFLAHLAELDERRLFLDLGYPSLFAYCTEKLGLSRSSAGRRIAAARVCRKFPEVFARVARGELQLSVLCELGKYLNSQNATELFEACRGKSYELALEILAARFPKPDVRDSIRRMPVRSADFTPDIGSEAGTAGGATSAAGGATSAAGAATSAAGAATSAATAVDSGQAQDLSIAAARMNAPDSLVISEAFAPAVAPAAPVRRVLAPLSADRFAVRFTVDTEFRELLAEVRALASHREAAPERGDGGLSSLVKRALQAYRRELQKQRFAVGRKPRLVRSQHEHGESGEPVGRGEPASRSRRVSAAVAREIYLRDGGCCTFCSEDGRRCGERRFLQLDHVLPWAAGGESTVENLRLRCRAHNQHSARHYFGASYVNAAIARVRGKHQRGGSG
jgi:hypothetical protein